MTFTGPYGLPIYIAVVLAVLGIYVAYRRRHVSDLTTGEAAHFEPMMQTGGEVLQLILDQSQPDLFDDPSFYDESELDRLGGMVGGKQAG